MNTPAQVSRSREKLPVVASQVVGGRTRTEIPLSMLQIPQSQNSEAVTSGSPTIKQQHLPHQYFHYGSQPQQNPLLSSGGLAHEQSFEEVLSHA
jgi:hypothetical protein